MTNQDRITSGWKERKSTKCDENKKIQAHKLLQTSSSTLCNHLGLTMDGIHVVFDLYCHPLDTHTEVSSIVHNINAITTQVSERYGFGTTACSKNERCSWDVNLMYHEH